MSNYFNPYGPTGNSPGKGIPGDNPFGNPVNSPTDPVGSRIFGINSYTLGNRDFKGFDPVRPFGLYDQSFDYGLDRGRWRHAYARVIHLSPNSPAMDVYLDGKLFYNGLNYRSQTDYLGVRPGNHRIMFYRAGHIRYPVFYKTLFVPRRSIVSLVINGVSGNLDVMVVDDKTSIPPGRVKVKAAHLSPHAPSLDLTADRSVWFNQIVFQEVSEYITVTSGRETLGVRISGIKQPLLTVPRVQFARNRAFTIYITGLVNSAPPLELLVTLDSSGKLRV